MCEITKEGGDGLLPLGKPIWSIEHLNFIFVSRFWTINYCRTLKSPDLWAEVTLSLK